MNGLLNNNKTKENKRKQPNKEGLTIEATLRKTELKTSKLVIKVKNDFTSALDAHMILIEY